MVSINLLNQLSMKLRKDVNSPHLVLCGAYLLYSVPNPAWGFNPDVGLSEGNVS